MLLTLLATLNITYEQNFLGGAYLTSYLALFGQLLIIGIAIFISLLSITHPLKNNFFQAEISSIYLMVLLGMLVMISSEDLITIFIGLEIASIGIYALSGYLAPTQKSLEGAVKYYILGALATSFILFGIALLYASLGTLNLTLMIQKSREFFF